MRANWLLCNSHHLDRELLLLVKRELSSGCSLAMTGLSYTSCEEVSSAQPPSIPSPFPPAVPSWPAAVTLKLCMCSDWTKVLLRIVTWVPEVLPRMTDGLVTSTLPSLLVLLTSLYK